MKFTIFGSSGFIGGHLASYLHRRGHEVWLPSRDGNETLGQNLGHVVYAVGMTANFRGQPFATNEAHVGMLARLLQHTSFDSWLYLSSTRVYGVLDQDIPAREDAAVSVVPGADSVYDISKLLGEALCLSLEHPCTRVARLSNVYGPGQNPHTFLASVISELSTNGHALIHEAPSSSKDYVALADVLALIERIALVGRQRLYNLASGHNVTHSELAARLTQLTGKQVDFAKNAPVRTFPKIDISRTMDEFGYIPAEFLNELETLLADSAN